MEFHVMRSTGEVEGPGAATRRSRGRTMSPCARGDTSAPHGTLQRLLGFLRKGISAEPIVTIGAFETAVLHEGPDVSDDGYQAYKHPPS